MNRARIKEIAEDARRSVPMIADIKAIDAAIESALLRFAEELLTQEPTTAMYQVVLTYLQKNDEWTVKDLVAAMSAQLLKEVKGE